MRALLKWFSVLVALASAALVAVAVAPLVGLRPLEAEALGSGLWVVKDGHVGLGLISLGEGKAALVDAGNDPAGGAILAALSRENIDKLDVVAILLTHAHPDHTAACGLFPRAKVYIGEAEIPYARGQLAYHGPLPALLGPQTSDCTALEPARTGEALRLGKRTITPFVIPGHTAGSVAWLVDDVLFIGDSAAGSAGEPPALRGAPWVFSDDLAQNQRSLAGLALKFFAAPPRLVVPSHSGPVPGTALTVLAGE